MKVATNRIFSESADLLLDARRNRYKLLGIVCPFIELQILKEILNQFNYDGLRIITDKGTIGSWFKQIKNGETPGKQKDDGTYLSPKRLDWIESLKSVADESFQLIVKIDWKKIIVNIQVEPPKKLHTKLYVFDKAFVVTSANITDEGSLIRHLEMGVLITETDNRLQTEIVKNWFEDRWTRAERSCLALKVQITLELAKKIIDEVLKEEIEENQKLHSNSENYFSNRLFCFGCDEERNGEIRSYRLILRNKSYIEIICQGCAKIFDKIRIFMPSIVQEMSHEGRIIWRISADDYNDRNTYLYRFEKYDSDNNSVAFDLTDNGSIDKIILYLIASNIEDMQICMSCGKSVRLDSSYCPFCASNNILIL